MPPDPTKWAWRLGRHPAQSGAMQNGSEDEAWTGCNYNFPHAQHPDLQLPNKQLDWNIKDLRRRIWLAHMRWIQADAQRQAVENNIQPDPHTDDLMKQLRRVLEFYLSREQLANNLYLQSQMDNEQYVSMATLASLRAIELLGVDLELIAHVVQTVQNVQMSPCGQKVRVNHSQYVLILREIAAGTPRQEVEALFRDEKVPKFLSCEFVKGDYCFLTYRSQAKAYQAYKYLCEEVGVFQGKPIKEQTSPPRQPSPIEQGVFSFHPLSVISPEPIQPSSTSAGDITSKASEKPFAGNHLPVGRHLKRSR
ncbi:la-related protein 4B-like isoform X2 [Festucalex cinctus]